MFAWGLVGTMVAALFGLRYDALGVVWGAVMVALLLALGLAFHAADLEE